MTSDIAFGLSYLAFLSLVALIIGHVVADAATDVYGLLLLRYLRWRYRRLRTRRRGLGT